MRAWIAVLRRAASGAVFRRARPCLAPALLALALAAGGCQHATVARDAGAGPAAPEPAAVREPARPEPAPAADPAAPRIEPDPPRVAFLAPLSGRGARAGRALLDAAQLALFEAAGDDLELLIHDTGGAPGRAAEAARRAIADGARLILGPLFAESARAAGEAAAGTGVGVIGFSNDRGVAGNGVYVFGFLPEQQARRAVRAAAEEGRRALAILAPSGPFGERVAEAARDAAERSGMSIARTAFHDEDEPDLAALARDFADYDRRKAALEAQRALLAKAGDPISRRALDRLSGLDTLGDPPYDAVFLPAGGTRLLEIAPLLAFYDVDPARVRLLGTARWEETPGIGAEPALAGGRYAAAAPEGRRAFEEKFARAYGEAPPRLASLGYDAMLLAIALSYLDGGADYGPAALTDAGGFAGADGIFRLLPDGTNRRGLAVMEVGDREVRVIDPAPARFGEEGS